MNDDDKAVETAWRIHGAIADWTGKVDTKASFALTLETAILGLVVALSDRGHRLHGLHAGWSRSLFWVGIGLLIGSILAALAVVSPQIRWKRVKTQSGANFIFFGHVRHWKPGDLEDALRDRELLPVLTRQLVVMSSIAWWKHVAILISLMLAVTGACSVSLASFVR